MKRLLVLISILSSFCALSQPIVNRASSANTVSDARLQAGLNLYLPRYFDTTAAATSIGIDSTGSVIYTYTPNAVWVRKANPKRWVQIVDVANGTYAAGYGLVLGGMTFRVDTALVSSLARLYKVTDSFKAYNASTFLPFSDTAAMLSHYVRIGGVPTSTISEVLTAGNDADGKSIYNLSSLFALDTLSTGGTFQLGYGIYTVRFPRILTNDRILTIPDKTGTLLISGDSTLYATPHYVDSAVAAGGAVPTLQQVTDAGHATDKFIDQMFAGTSVLAVSLRNDDDNGYAEAHRADGTASAVFAPDRLAFTIGGFGYVIGPPSTNTGNSLIYIPDNENGTIATREWVTANGTTINLTTTGTSGAATWNSGTRTLNIPQYAGTTYTAGNGISISSGVIKADTSVISTKDNVTNAIAVAAANYSAKTIALNTQSASYTLTLSDADGLVRMNVGSANNLTVPPNSSVAYSIGTKISVSNSGAGQVTFVAGAGVTINSADGALKLRVQYSAGTLIKTATDTWLLMGDITN